MKQSKRKSNISTFMTCLIKTINEYFSVSSITGLKIFWCLVLIVSFIFCNILVAHFWLRYKSNSTRMVVASNHLPLPTAPLPALTICPIGHTHPNRLAAFISEINYDSKEYSAESLKRMFKQSSGFFETMTYNVSELTIVQNLIDMNQYTVRRVMDTIQNTCNDIFVRCRFEGFAFNCSNLFKAVTSQYGNCCTFNGYRDFNTTLSPNGRTSISLLLRSNDETFISSERIRFFIYEANTSASIAVFESMLSHETETFVDIAPEINMCSNAVGQTPIDQRNCLYEGEKQLKYFSRYRESSCRLECILKKMVRACQCLPYYYAMYSRTTKVCDFTDIKCLVDKYWSTYHQQKNETKDCECMANCMEITYHAFMSQTRLQPNYFEVGSFYEGLSDEHIILHISFGREVFRAIQKDLATNVLALTANLGGIYSLFIGFSAITFFEIVYYVCVRSYTNYKKQVLRHKSENVMHKKLFNNRM
ncbi:sodium channel protein Nach-like [Contarinia nasturtii]|uniref:sodium channel protein Nach-like n=1 Tax=Contarinia nasturtii TaxID=265458 RepID=UPI0012D38360|nr:sodium channel protein Nach-like [Contarinia nasturtii]